MMGDVTGDDVSQRPGADGIAAGLPAICPGLGGQTVQQGPSALSYAPEFVHQRPKWPAIEAARRDVCLLIKAGEWGRVAPRNSEKPIRKDALRIAEMAQDLLNAPLTGRIPSQGGFVID
jgi:hypothetical protein